MSGTDSDPDSAQWFAHSETKVAFYLDIWKYYAYSSETLVAPSEYYR